MRNYVLPILTFVLSVQSCISKTEDGDRESQKTEVKDTLESSSSKINVQWYGTLKNMMHKGDLSAQVDLQEVQKKNLYALGALENLKGEILIWNGQPLVSKMAEEHINIDSSWDHKAALLVSSTIKNWQTISVPSSVKDMKALTVFIKNQAVKNNIDVDKPFPFLIRGKVDSLQWHVVDWPIGDTVHTHKKHVTSGAYGTRANIVVDILGFYSTKHKGIFTHHSSDVHMHFKTEHYPFAGHVDAVYLNESKLYLPN